MDIIFIIIHFNPSFHVKLSYCEKKNQEYFSYINITKQTDFCYTTTRSLSIQISIHYTT